MSQELFRPHKEPNSTRDITQRVEWLSRNDPVIGQLYVAAVERVPSLADCILREPQGRGEIALMRTGGGDCILEDGKLTIVFDFENLDSARQFITKKKQYIAYLAKQLGISKEAIRLQPKLFQYFSLLHELGHAAHFYTDYFPPGSSDIGTALTNFYEDYARVFTETKDQSRGISPAKWIEAYWNMPFEREANDFAVEQFQASSL